MPESPAPALLNALAEQKFEHARDVLDDLCGLDGVTDTHFLLGELGRALLEGLHAVALVVEDTASAQLLEGYGLPR